MLPEGGKRVIFSYEHAGLEKLYSIDASGGDVREEPSLPTGSINSLSSGGKALVGVWESSHQPAGNLCLQRQAAEAADGLQHGQGK